MSTRITRTLLAAAAALGASTTASKAYYQNDWVGSYSWNRPSTGSSGYIGDNTNQTIGTLNVDSVRADAGVYSHASYYFYWDFNYFGGGSPDYAATYGTINGSYGSLTYGSQSVTSGNSSFSADSNNYSIQVLPLGTTDVTLHEQLNGDWNAYAEWSLDVYERAYQVARTNDSTGSQGFGFNSAFESDNYDTSAYYGANIGGRSYVASNVLSSPAAPALRLPAT